MRFFKSKLLPSFFNSILIDLASPVNLGYIWNLGSILGLCLIIQLASGIFLASHYSPVLELAFFSVQQIVTQVFGGSTLRSIHATVASLFFIFTYLHIAKAIYYGSYVGRIQLWFSGVLLFLILMATAFLGYTLPWGQMSLWGAVVITSFFSAIPYIGNDLTLWIWGSWSVGGATLNRFFTLHYLAPFILTGVVFIHIILLHEHGSNNMLGIRGGIDKIKFAPYFIVKDALGYMLFGLLASILVFYFPRVMGHESNFLEANPLVTPTHIVPEFYFLAFYAILRAIPNKLGGVAGILGGILVLTAFPITHTSVIKSSSFRTLYKQFLWLFFLNYLLLTYFGGETTGLIPLRVSVAYYFLFILVISPLIGSAENYIRS